MQPSPHQQEAPSHCPRPDQPVHGTSAARALAAIGWSARRPFIPRAFGATVWSAASISWKPVCLSIVPLDLTVMWREGPGSELTLALPPALPFVLGFALLSALSAALLSGMSAAMSAAIAAAMAAVRRL